MKVYSIGREYGCDIVIDDNTDVISRRHATLNVSPTGKMTIVDLSHNGTYVNGIRINQNVPVPVTRKDNISFAHVARLDWDLIPNTNALIIRYSIMGLLAILLIGGGIWAFNVMGATHETGGEGQPTVETVDSTELKKQEMKIREEEKAKQDSIKKHVEDSLNKVRQANKKAKTVKKESKKDTKKEDKKENKEEKKQTRIH